MNDVFHHPDKRLKSRHPIWNEATDQATLHELRKKQWKGLKNGSPMAEANIKLPGFERPQPIWTTLNRIQTDQGKCNPFQKWSFFRDICFAQTELEGVVENIYRCNAEAINELILRL